MFGKAAILLALLATAYAQVPCGVKGGATPDPKIVGGQEADDHEYPWQVSLQQKGIVTSSHYCGGSVISANYVLTAGHCVEGFTASEVQVVAGINNLRDAAAGQTVDVSRLIQHEDYDPVDLTSDVAVVELASPLTLDGTTVAPICLPDPDLRTTDTSTVTGWGTTREGGALSQQLLEVDLPFVDDDTCETAYEALGGTGWIFESMICYGDLENGGIDSCQGDSGGPLIVLRADGQSYEEAGIVSWGYGCAEVGYPGVYTETAYHTEWIQKNSDVTRK